MHISDSRTLAGHPISFRSLDDENTIGWFGDYMGPLWLVFVRYYLGLQIASYCC